MTEPKPSPKAEEYYWIQWKLLDGSTEWLVGQRNEAENGWWIGGSTFAVPDTKILKVGKQVTRE